MPTSKSSSKLSSSSPKAQKPAARHAGLHDKSDETSDAVKLLMDDHKAVKKQFTAYEKLVKDEAPGSEKQGLANQICMLLTIHTAIEEELFYPAARQSLADADLLDEAEVEHASAKDLIAQIQSMSPEDNLYDAKVTVLGEYIAHHVKEEETEMFPQVKKAKMDIDRLGDEMAARKEALTAEAAKKAVH